MGPWLPEPLATEAAGSAPDTAERAVFTETVTLAMLVVMEALSPLERAVFVLREAFGYPYGEIATVLDRGEAAVRQLAARARRHVEGRPRFEVNPERQRELTERFLAAAAGEDLKGLLRLLAADARLVGDSGGKSKAPLRIIRSADKVARFLVASPAGRRPAWSSVSWNSTAGSRCWPTTEECRTASSSSMSWTAGSPRSTSCATPTSSSRSGELTADPLT